MENLKILRKQYNLKQIDMAKMFNISKSTYSTYETGACEPSIELLKKFADYFHCSIDYLVGRESEDGIIDMPRIVLTKDEEYLLDITRHLPQKEKDIAYCLVETLHEYTKK